MLPPTNLGRQEAGQIQWWAPRLGGLLAVLTVVFLSVYVSRNTTPAIRFAQLIAVDTLAIGLGVYFWKRRPRFASILLSTGLSMLYVSVVAGYAAAPVRVFENPIIGIVSQFATVAGIFLISLVLKQRSIALLGSSFGFTSTIFSAYAGLNEGALLSAFALQLAGLVIGARWRFQPLIVISGLAVYLPILTFCGLAVIRSQSFTTPWFSSALGFLAVAVSGLPALALFSRAKGLFSKKAWRTLQIANTSLCGFLGYSYLKLIGGDLVILYGTLAIVFGGWAACFSRQGLRSLLFQLFFLKGCGLTALWMANYFSGELRWFALAIEVLLLAWSTRISRSRWSEAATFALWLAANYIALGDLSASGEIEAFGFPWALYLALPALGAIAFSWQLGGLEAGPLRRVAYGLAGVANGVVWCLATAATNLGNSEAPMYFVAGAALFATPALLPKLARLPLATACIVPLVIGNAAFWQAPQSLPSFATTFGATLLIALGGAKANGEAVRRRSLIPEFLALALAHATLFAYLMNEYGSYFWFPLVGPLIAIATQIAPSERLKTLADSFPIPILLALVFQTWLDAPLGMRALSLVLYFGLLVLPLFQANWAKRYGLLQAKGSWNALAHLLVALVVVGNVLRIEGWLASVSILLTSGAAFFSLWFPGKRKISLATAVALFLMCFGSIVYQVINYGTDSPWSWQILCVGALLSLTAIGGGVALRLAKAPSLKNGTTSGLSYLLAGLGFATAATSLSYPGLDFESIYTPLMAIFCLALVALGIATRIKPYRAVALVGFLLPLGRLFIFDIRETLYRIIAFAAVAVLLTFIGYLYSRFASRID